MALLTTDSDKLKSLLSLSLTKGNNSKSLHIVSCLCKLEELVGWIGSYLKDEDQWSELVHIVVHVFHSNWLTLSVEGSHVHLDIVLEGEHEFLTSEDLQENTLLELSDLL